MICWMLNSSLTFFFFSCQHFEWHSNALGSTISEENSTLTHIIFSFVCDLSFFSCYFQGFYFAKMFFLTLSLSYLLELQLNDCWSAGYFIVDFWVLFISLKHLSHLWIGYWCILRVIYLLIISIFPYVFNSLNISSSNSLYIFSLSLLRLRIATLKSSSNPL